MNLELFKGSTWDWEFCSEGKARWTVIEKQIEDVQKKKVL